MIGSPVALASLVSPATLAWLAAGVAILLALAIYALTRGPQDTPFLNVLWHIDRTYVRVWHRLAWRGEQHIPREGPVILASNHTAGIDPFIIQAPCPRLVRWVMLTTHRFGLIEPIWRALRPITLDRESGGDLAKLREVVRALKHGDVVGLFPEGGLQREHRELQPFAAGLGMIAKRSGATIVPVWVQGTPRSRHMRDHFLRRGRCRVTFGGAYVPDPSLSAQQIVADLRQRMLALAAS